MADSFDEAMVVVLKKAARPQASIGLHCRSQVKQLRQCLFVLPCITPKRQFHVRL